jgi:hypothetical protein
MPLRPSNGKGPGALFFAAYVGPSMNPTLRAPEIMEIVPYGDRPVRVGDVVFFLPPGSDQPVVHRAIRATARRHCHAGRQQRPGRCLPGAARADPRTGGGRAAGAAAANDRGRGEGAVDRRWLGWRRALDHGASPLLHPVYQALHRRGWIARWLPAALPAESGRLPRAMGGISASFCWGSGSSGDTTTNSINGKSSGPSTCWWMGGRFRASRIGNG